MATIKSYTDLEQSRKLAEILSLETADMCYILHASSDNLDWRFDNDIPPMVLGKISTNELTVKALPCWSLAALLGVLPQGEYKDADLCFGGYKGDEYIPEWFCSYEQQEPFIIEICHADNPVDACVAMIERLYKLKML